MATVVVFKSYDFFKCTQWQSIVWIHSSDLMVFVYFSVIYSFILNIKYHNIVKLLISMAISTDINIYGVVFLWMQ